MAYPSTFADIRAAVIAKARLDSTADATRVNDWINQTYADLTIDTQALQREDTITLTAGAASYTMPSAVVRINQIVARQSGQTVYGPPLVLISLADMLERRQSDGGTPATNSTPTHYTLVGQDELELWPTPSDAGTLLVYYVKQPTALSGDTDLPGIPEPYASKCLEHGALVDAYDYIKDFIAKNQAEQTYEIWKMKYRQHLVRRKGSQTLQLFAGDTGPVVPHDPSTDIRGGW